MSSNHHRSSLGDRKSNHHKNKNSSSSHHRRKSQKEKQDEQRHQVEQRLEKIFHEGTTTIVNRIDELPKFTLEEIEIGSILGKGGFGTVREICAFNINIEDARPGAAHDNGGTDPSTSISHHNDDTGNEDDDDDDDDNILQGNRLFMAEHCLRKGGKGLGITGKKKKKKKQARYAIKQLSSDVYTSTSICGQGMTDMAVETRFLSGLLHPNIIKLRAIADCPPWAGGGQEYFIVMDRLYLTLEDQIHKVWKSKRDWQQSIAGKICLCDCFSTKSTAHQSHTLWEERMVYAYDLASALSYLHQRKILYRDVKPENIGFDIRNDIKLFDFGLAREITQDSLRVDEDEDSEGNDSALYNLTAYTGSPIYMAPEVALGQPYNGTCDTYSFSILLWEMLSLQLPYEYFTLKLLKQRVWGKEEKRPAVPPTQQQTQEDANHIPTSRKSSLSKKKKMDHTSTLSSSSSTDMDDDTYDSMFWPKSIRQLLEQGWIADPTKRLTMVQVEKRLRWECIQLRGSEAGLEHQRRRSTYVYKAPPKKKKSQRRRSRSRRSSSSRKNEQVVTSE